MIKSFEFNTPTRIKYGRDSIKGIWDEIMYFDSKRPLIVADKGIVDSGLLKPIEKNFKEKGIEANIFSDIDINPRDLNCEEGALFAKDIDADLILAVGGGSSIDAAKVIGMLATNGGKVRDYLGYGKVRKKGLPLIAIPTTAGTGTEVTIWAVITDTSGAYNVKRGLGSVLMCPTVAVLDPDLTVSLPPHLTASTGMDALTHAIEAYTSLPANPLSDICALRAISYISKYLPMAYANGNNIEARDYLMMGSLLAGIAFSNSGTTATHSLSEGIGGLFDIPHGVANAVLLPFVMEYNLFAIPERFADVSRVMGANIESLGIFDAASKSVKLVKRLSKILDIPNFKTFEIEKDDFQKIAKVAMTNSGTLANPRELGEKDFITILNMAYNIV